MCLYSVVVLDLLNNTMRPEVVCVLFYSLVATWSGVGCLSPFPLGLPVSFELHPAIFCLLFPLYYLPLCFPPTWPSIFPFPMLPPLPPPHHLALLSVHTFTHPPHGDSMTACWLGSLGLLHPPSLGIITCSKTKVFPGEKSSKKNDIHNVLVACY